MKFSAKSQRGAHSQRHLMVPCTVLYQLTDDDIKCYEYQTSRIVISFCYLFCGYIFIVDLCKLCLRANNPIMTLHWDELYGIDLYLNDSAIGLLSEVVNGLKLISVNLK